MYADIARANPDLRALCKLEGSSFRHMLVVYDASLNGFILGCRKILFIDEAHLRGPHKGTILPLLHLMRTTACSTLHMQLCHDRQ